jgi:hypothetical protein
MELLVVVVETGICRDFNHSVIFPTNFMWSINLVGANPTGNVKVGSEKGISWNQLIPSPEKLKA